MKARRQCGNIISEYLVVLLFLTSVLAYAIMGRPGSSPDGGADGDPDTNDPIIISAINDKQQDFARDIYQP
ncbi:MAG: hypothetical protein SV765_06315 [Pseudomonadota bacterium]|nr:hypothetical protein [Pseudomonadota bacterium]|tara:strand:- start:386 stop:598 length:213 start_codon:yes stop_codon:yes gene_type:complete